MKICSSLLFIALTAAAWGQQANASMSPIEVTAGKSITITITVDAAPFADNMPLKDTVVNAILSPREPKDNPPPFSCALNPNNNDPKVYSLTVAVPVSAKGTWFLRDANLVLPGQAGNHVLLINTPEFRVKPADLKLPTKGKAEITTP